MGSQDRKPLVESASDGQVIQAEPAMFRKQLAFSHGWESWGRSSARHQLQSFQYENCLKFGSLPEQVSFPFLIFHCRVKNWHRRMRKETCVNGRMETWNTTDIKIYKEMWKNTSLSEMELGYLEQVRGQKVPGYPFSEEVLYSLSGWCLAGPGSHHLPETRDPYCLRSGPAEDTANAQGDVSGLHAENWGKPLGPGPSISF